MGCAGDSLTYTIVLFRVADVGFETWKMLWTCFICFILVYHNHELDSY